MSIYTIEKFLALPLNFIATIAYKTYKIFKSKKEHTPKNVLLIGLSKMSNAIILDPAMRKLKENIGGELYFLTLEKNKKTLHFLNTVKNENIYTINEKGIFSLIKSTFNFIKWCKEKQIDSVIDLERFSRLTSLLSCASGASNKVGFYSFFNEGSYKGGFLSHKVAYNPHLHMAKNFIALVDSLLSSEKQTPYLKRQIKDEELVLVKPHIDVEKRAITHEILASIYEGYERTYHKIVLINPSTSEVLPQKRWDRVNYAQVIEKILERDQRIIILLIGVSSEYEEIDDLRKMVENKRCINFIEKVDFLELPALYSESEFMITNNSSNAHFAAITDMHTYVILGPETPTLFSSLGSSTPIYSNMSCSPCINSAFQEKTVCDDNRCLQVITPEQVFDTIKEQIDKF